MLPNRGSDTVHWRRDQLAMGCRERSASREHLLTPGDRQATGSRCNIYVVRSDGIAPLQPPFLEMGAPQVQLLCDLYWLLVIGRHGGVYWPHRCTDGQEGRFLGYCRYIFTILGVPEFSAPHRSLVLDHTALLVWSYCPRVSLGNSSTVFCHLSIITCSRCSSPRQSPSFSTWSSCYVSEATSTPPKAVGGYGGFHPRTAGA